MLLVKGSIDFLPCLREAKGGVNVPSRQQHTCLNDPVTSCLPPNISEEMFTWAGFQLTTGWRA
jgi:hypothetical protein